jgi:hypothetical protein
MRLPSCGPHDLAQRGSLGTPDQLKDLSGLALRPRFLRRTASHLVGYSDTRKNSTSGAAGN